ncbi:MAG: ABC transporter ATP-binding protein [Candidatus Koribacter versatilis]|uniref:ABC transporter ATP-binding protein n=1 Tax=Candidatus Korobacter versatilis TaxID=658062 RepID=A0A932ENK1_9BACT|nr:ABC transporter ATP-binding protein [Candidatus Koribacter versatilis]
MGNDAALRFDGVTKEYRGFLGRTPVPALDKFSLTVERGEIFGFLGPNGAGKTTAIHIAMGFMKPTRGAGQMLEKGFGHAATRARVGFLAENVALVHRPAESAVRYYGALNGLRGVTLTKRTREMLELLELEDVVRRNVAKLSRGMLQRAGLAQALVNDPELLVLDEPTSALDPLGRVAVRELLLRAKAAGKTVFLSSHMLSEIELICDRIAILVRGRVARVGKTNELLESRDEAEVVFSGASGAAFPEAVLENEMLRVTVPKSAQRATIEKVWAAGGEVVKVNPARRSLEGLFVSLANQAGPGATVQKPGAAR